MPRTETLRRRIGMSMDRDPCLVCAKISWLHSRLRKFHVHIARRERRLYSDWCLAHTVLLGEAADTADAQDDWASVRPAVERRWAGHSSAVERIKTKTSRLKRDTEAYRLLVKKESQQYINHKIPFPWHVRWYERLSEVAAQWGRDHPICQGVDDHTQCGMRMGGHHWATPDADGLCPLCVSERRRGGPVRPRDSTWIPDGPASDEPASEEFGEDSDDNVQ